MYQLHGYVRNKCIRKILFILMLPKHNGNVHSFHNVMSSVCLTENAILVSDHAVVFIDSTGTIRFYEQSSRMA